MSQPISLAPVNEQHRIVEKLNAALTGVERGEKASRRAQERLRRYRVAVLRAAVTGELTRPWRENRRTSKDEDTETGEALLSRILKIRRDEWGGRGNYKEPVPPVPGFLPNPPEGWTTCSLEQITLRIPGQGGHGSGIIPVSIPK
jgi:type I restriction enzyme S subunit